MATDQLVTISDSANLKLKESVSYTHLTLPTKA